MGVTVAQYILTDDLAPATDQNVIPDPVNCCRLCSGTSGKTLYTDISRTTEAGCPIFFLSFATGVGWICQYHSDDATVASTYATPSIAYVPV